jgi:hypothetical protein
VGGRARGATLTIRAKAPARPRPCPSLMVSGGRCASCNAVHPSVAGARADAQPRLEPCGPEGGAEGTRNAGQRNIAQYS